MSTRRKLALLLLFLLPVVWQLWVPPYTGLADNGDFAKVVGRFSLGPSEHSEQDTFHFFIREWRMDPKFDWVSPYWGVEVWLSKAALWLSGSSLFDVRWLGLIHVLLFAGFAWQLIGLRTAALA